MDPVQISETLEALAERRLSATRTKELRPLKGVRGVPDGEIARVAAEVWSSSPPALPRDQEQLDRLFGGAYEDGIVAIGLLATLLSDQPKEVYALTRSWLTRVDDIGTADALGWVLLGPAFLSAAGSLSEFLSLQQTGQHVAVRRAIVLSAMAMLPVPVQGPAAAPLREKLNERVIQFVPKALSPTIGHILTRAVKDMAPAVQKAIRRVLRVWTTHDPEAALTWCEERNNLPKLHHPERDKARRLVRKRQREANEGQTTAR